MIEINKIYLRDSLEGMKEMVQQKMKVDLIITDPPYDIAYTKTSTKTQLAKNIQKVCNELENNHLVKGISKEFLELMVALQDKINIYIWCNGKQIPFYLDYFVKELKCKYDILIWNKTNAIPTFSNKYLSDKEYVLYFRKGGFCNPCCYEDAKTIYISPINSKDKKKYNHPTIKPLDFIMRMLKNSSKEGQLVLDPFGGSGTTAVAAKSLNRNFITFEIDKRYYEISNQRLQELTVASDKEEKCLIGS